MARSPGCSGSSRPGRGWVMVRAKFLTAESIIAALEAGFFRREIADAAFAHILTILRPGMTELTVSNEAMNAS